MPDKPPTFKQFGPTDGPSKPPSTPADKAFGRGCLFIVLAPVLLIAGCTAFALSNNDSPSASDNSYEAIAQCETRVEQLLKAPATAEFDTNASGGPRQYVVSGTVDSENGFGAMLRSEFQCQVMVNEDSATTSVDFVR